MTFNANRAADVVGVVTLAVGTALVVSPGQTGAALGLGGDTGTIRAIGIADLVLAPALLIHRKRRDFPMAIRAALNVAIAIHYLRRSRGPDATARSRTGAIAMLALAVTDGSLALALRNQHRNPPTRRTR